MRRLIVVVLVAAAAVATGPTVAAQDTAGDAAAVAAELDFRGYHVEPGAAADVNEIERLVAGIDGERFYFVALASTPAEGADAFAAEVLPLVSEPGTVFVLTPDEIGAASDDFDDEAVGRGLDAALEAGGGLEARGRAFADAVRSGGAGGGLGWLWLLVPLAVIVVGVVWWTRRGRSRDAEDLEQARAEIRRQLDAVASQVVELGDAVSVGDDEIAAQHYRAATETYSEVEEELDAAGTFLELAALADRLDEARWRMEAAEALAEGRPEPPRPERDEPVACFFDPSHRPGTEAAVVRTAAGDKQVQVCRSCAEQLDRGEAPATRDIAVGTSRRPAAQAPRSHGGSGLDGLGAFEIVLGGLGAVLGSGGIAGRRGVPYDWTRSGRTRRGRGGAVFAPQRAPSRRSPLPNRTRRPKGRGRRRL